MSKQAKAETSLEDWTMAKIKALLEANEEQIQKDIQTLSPLQRLKVFDSLVKYMNTLNKNKSPFDWC